MNIKFITLGSDPEFFVLDPRGKPYPSTHFAKGTKDAPSPIGNGFFEQRDNLSFEGNIPPAKTKEEFINNVTCLREYFISKVSRFGYSISPNGVEFFARKYLQLPEALEFGCSSVVDSWNSHVGYISERPTPIMNNVKYRVSGFHIHIGYEVDKIPFLTDRDINILIGRLFDIFLTTPSHKIKDEPERLQSYGRYGMIRNKSYGVECRTLSTFFTQKEYLPWVWDQVMKVQDFMNVCPDEDLKEFIKNGAFVSYTASFKNAIVNILSRLKNKEILNKFEEFKIYKYDKKKTVESGIYTASFSSDDTNYTTTASTTHYTNIQW